MHFRMVFPPEKSDALPDRGGWGRSNPFANHCKPMAFHDWGACGPPNPPANPGGFATGPPAMDFMECEVPKVDPQRFI